MARFSVAANAKVNRKVRYINAAGKMKRCKVRAVGVGNLRDLELPDGTTATNVDMMTARTQTNCWYFGSRRAF